jgi:Core-2/I-Branching enzyme.
MRMAYLILAHEDEAQLDALLDVLVPSGASDVAIIHADRRSALWASLRRRKCEDGRVVILRDPVDVRWGHSSQVEATAKLVVAASRAGCDYAHLISGADWPVITPAAMAARIAAEAKPACYIEARQDYMCERMQTYRFDSRWLRLSPENDRLAYALNWQLRRAARVFDALRERAGFERSRPWGPWYYGSQWWSLPAEAIELLARELPALIGSGRLAGTVCADEHVIPTIINHAFADRIADNRRFVSFPAGASSPRLLGADDHDAIVRSEAWFMRKVSAAHSTFFRQFPAA